MGLPQNFQPRPCPFCGSRHLLNAPEEDGSFKVSCLFCGGSGPAGMKSNDDAWLAWNGQRTKAPAMFGGIQEVTL